MDNNLKNLETYLASFNIYKNDVYFEFNNTFVKPNYINSNIVIDIYNLKNNIDKIGYKQFNIISKDIHEIYEKMYIYNKLGYLYCVIWEEEIEQLLNNKPKTIDDFISLCEIKKKYDFYVAGPFFNEEQIKSMEKVETILNKYNKTMFRPRFDAGCIDLKTSTNKDCYITFKNDLLGIESSKIILANTTYKDSGTSVEIGYALNIPHVDIWLINDIKTSGKKVNLMLAQAAKNSFSSYKELNNYLDSGLEKQFISNFEIE